MSKRKPLPDNQITFYRGILGSSRKENKMTNSNLPEKFPNFVLFKTADGKVNIDVYFHNETLWLSQKLLAELFQKDRSVISKHLKNIFEEGELNEQVVCAKFALTTQHGAIEGKTQQKEVMLGGPHCQYNIFMKQV